MEVRVSKDLANYMSSIMKKNGIKAEAKVVEFTERGYEMNVDFNSWEAELNGDYNRRTGKYRAIAIIYDESYYACNNYITTKRLQDEWKCHHPKTVEDMNRILIDMVNI